MLDEAAFADTEQDVGGAVVKVRRGELCASQAMLEEITGLSRQQLRTFLSALENAGSITTRPATKSTKSRTIVTFCNYGKYQNDQPKANQASTKDQPIKEQGKQDNNTSPLTPQGGDGEFQAFWDAYPHRNGQKKNRKGAEAKFAAALKRGVTADQIMAGVKAMSQFPDVQRGFARDPVTWLNQQGWTDEPPTAGLTVINGGKPYKTDYQGRPEIGSEMVNAKGHKLRYINHYDGWMREWN